MATDGQTQVSLTALADWFLDRSWGIASGVVIADVSGKGVPASLIMAMCRSVLRSQAASQLSPAAVNHYERGVTTSSVSKTLGMSGTRLGWLASQDRDVVDVAVGPNAVVDVDAGGAAAVVVVDAGGAS